VRLFIFGLGYVGTALGQFLNKQGWIIGGTTRSPDKAAKLKGTGFTVFPLLPEPQHLDTYDAFLISIPPDAEGDPIWQRYQTYFRTRQSSLHWLGYLSSTAVYGDHQGRWVTEMSPTLTMIPRGLQRLKAEQQWLTSPLPAHIFRLSGLYGPERSVLDTLQKGKAHCIDKPGQVFSRIHRDDCVQILYRSLQQPHHGTIYNVADDYPAATAELLGFAATLLRMPPPPIVPYHAASLSPTQQSYYTENRRIDNHRVKDNLGVRLLYPHYRDGLQAISKHDYSRLYI
jgi:nucleoside-diphosphate-sugar epimerase